MSESPSLKAPEALPATGTFCGSWCPWPVAVSLQLCLLHVATPCASRVSLSLEGHQSLIWGLC